MNKLFNLLPDMYENATAVRNILNAQESQLDAEAIKRENVKKDTRPSTCVHPEYWENEYKIQPASTMEGRRKNIVAKMRGTGPTQAEKIIDIVEAYTAGAITVIEDADDSMVHIDINSPDATLSDIELMKAALYEALPSHLDFQYNYSRPISGKTRIAGYIQSTPAYNIGGAV